MKILEFKGKMSFKNKVLIALGVVVIIMAVAVVLVYSFNESAREWIDINVLRKEISEDNIATITLDVDKNEYVCAYDRYISVLQNGKLSIYNGYANKEADLDVTISNPIYAKYAGYLAIAEKNGERIYLISNTRILWENKTEGNIISVNVGKNGYVSVITTGTSHKSIVTVFDRNGKELFKRFLASTIAVDTDISVNGKYLAIAGVNTSTSIIESSINVIDIEKATSGEGEASVVFKQSVESNKIITDIKYGERGELVCMYDDSIHMIYNDEDKTLIEFGTNTKIADIDLKSNIIRTEEVSANLFSSKTDVILKSIITGLDTTYEVDSSVKEIVCFDQIAAVNLGTEIHFINLNGWLEKKYTSNQEAKEITLGTSIAGIVYRDRIKVFTF